MAKKPPRRTAERILETSQELFNRYGEPNVSTTAISAEMRISPGNLYYHYPAKDELINALFTRFDVALQEALQQCSLARTVNDASLSLHRLLELVWQYRFFYRDLNHLMSRNRQLEAAVQPLIDRKQHALQEMLRGLRSEALLDIDDQGITDTSNSMVVMATYWISFEYARNPRQALEPESAQQALSRGVQLVLNLLKPYLHPRVRGGLAPTQPAAVELTA